MRIFITGGSGFIGTNLVKFYISKGFTIKNFDKSKPRERLHLDYWTQGDILDKQALLNCINEFKPDYCIHLAARTDLHENKSLAGYDANIKGVENIVEVVNQSETIKRTIYASSRMVCRIDYIPQNFEDYCPPNLYGESKVMGEKIVRNMAEKDYIIVRPTSIWGPYFEVPYRTFFDTVRKNFFFLPSKHYPKKSFGFVYNTVYQIDKLLFTSPEYLDETYYLSDYPPIDLKYWADLVSYEFNGTASREFPMWALKGVSYLGDFLIKLGWKNAPLSSFRLNNLITNMVYDTSRLEKICGQLPYTLEEGVKITANWMKGDK